MVDYVSVNKEKLYREIDSNPFLKEIKDARARENEEDPLRLVIGYGNFPDENIRALFIKNPNSGYYDIAINISRIKQDLSNFELKMLCSSIVHEYDHQKKDAAVPGVRVALADKIFNPPNGASQEQRMNNILKLVEINNEREISAYRVQFSFIAKEMKKDANFKAQFEQYMEENQNSPLRQIYEIYKNNNNIVPELSTLLSNKEYYGVTTHTNGLGFYENLVERGLYGSSREDKDKFFHALDKFVDDRFPKDRNLSPNLFNLREELTDKLSPQFQEYNVSKTASDSIIAYGVKKCTEIGANSIEFAGVDAANNRVVIQTNVSHPLVIFDAVAASKENPTESLNSAELNLQQETQAVVQERQSLSHGGHHLS